MKHFLSLLILFALLIASSFGATVNLAWDPSPDADVVSYQLKYGTEPGKYTETQTLGKVTEGSVPATAGQQYYAVVVAVNAAGLVSDPSNEVTFKVPRPAPQLRVITQIPQANGMLLDITAEKSKALALYRDNGNGKWKRIHTFKNFSGNDQFLDKNWSKNKQFQWKVKPEKS